MTSTALKALTATTGTRTDCWNTPPEFVGDVLEFFNNKLEFETHLVKLNCSANWVEEKVIETVKIIQSNHFPKPSSGCEYCNYLKKRWLLQKNIEQGNKKK